MRAPLRTEREENVVQTSKYVRSSRKFVWPMVICWRARGS